MRIPPLPWIELCRWMKKYGWKNCESKISSKQIITPYPKIGWTVFSNVKIHPNKSLHHTQRLDEKLQNKIFHPRENCFLALFLSSRNVCSFSLARSKNSANSGDGLKDLFISISSKRYKPFRVFTLERTTYYQFFKSPPVGQDEII